MDILSLIQKSFKLFAKIANWFNFIFFKEIFIKILASFIASSVE